MGSVHVSCNPHTYIRLCTVHICALGHADTEPGCITPLAPTMRGQGSRVVRRGRSASSRSSHITPTDQSLCGTCNVDLGSDPIGCDKCETWVCSTEMCSGLPQNVIETIIQYDGSGIQFVCLKCRVSLTTAGGSTRTSNYQPQLAEIITQLAQQIKGICCELRDLKAHHTFRG